MIGSGYLYQCSCSEFLCLTWCFQRRKQETYSICPSTHWHFYFYVLFTTCVTRKRTSLYSTAYTPRSGRTRVFFSFFIFSLAFSINNSNCRVDTSVVHVILLFHVVWHDHIPCLFVLLRKKISCPLTPYFHFVLLQVKDKQKEIKKDTHGVTWKDMVDIDVLEASAAAVTDSWGMGRSSRSQYSQSKDIHTQFVIGRLYDYNSYALQHVPKKRKRKDSKGEPQGS